MIDGSTDVQGRAGASAVKVGLALGAIVLGAVVIFGLGVMEGSRVAGLAPEVAASPSPPPAQSLAPSPPAPVARATATTPDKLTFYDRLSGVAPAAPLTPPESQAAVPTHAPAPLAARETPLPLPAPAPRQQVQTPASAPTAGSLPRETEVTAPKAIAARTAVPAKVDPAAKIRKLTGKGRFTVQVAAVGERAAAAEAAALLKRNGFDAVTVMASIKGKIWYRIRVGSFPNKQAASQAAGLFHSAYGFDAIPVEN